MATKDDLARDAWRHLQALYMAGENAGRFPRIAGQLGLTPGQMKALLDLDQARPLPMRALAENMACDASYATSLVDTLERSGYVERHASETDRRVKLLYLTESGRETRARVIELLNDPPKSFSRLSATQLRAFTSMLAEIVDEFWF
jgi:MarR family transcriptional regulator, organic hydroperoxide resistance regulator